jgi:hypothetical protein
MNWSGFSQFLLDFVAAKGDVSAPNDAFCDTLAIRMASRRWLLDSENR